MQASSPLFEIFQGQDSRAARGFLLIAPQGYRLHHPVEAALRATYGTDQHPDIRRIAPDGKGGQITVETIRDSSSFLYATAAGPVLKTLVIYQAHRMNDSAANALLKPLEEPTAHTRLLLVTDRPWALPATILSRCLKLRWTPGPGDTRREIADFLAEREEDMPEDGIAKAALAAADGNPQVAAALISHNLMPWLDQLRKWLGEEKTASAPPLPALSGKSANITPLPLAALAAQTFLLRSARPDAAETGTLVKGWPAARSLRAATEMARRVGDIDRAGLDARTRMHSLLMAAKVA